MTDTLGKSECVWCGNPIQSIFNLLEVGDDEVMHETCYLKYRLDWESYWVKELQREVARLEGGMKRRVSINDKALPSLLGGIIETPMEGYED